TANRIFSVKVVGLRKVLYEGEWASQKIKPSEFNDFEKRIFDSLLNIH
ncbi:MAG: hypothetical protein RLY43_1983, partial [Bacteroidota bacterium]